MDVINDLTSSLSSDLNSTELAKDLGLGFLAKSTAINGAVNLGIKLLEMGPWRKEDGSWEGKYVPVPTTSGDLCEGRVAEGGVPSCVLHCLSNSIEYGTLEELAVKMAERGAQCSLFLP